MEQASREPRIGFDLESNGFFRYPERICLIQLSTSKRIYLLDPLAIDDMSPLGEVLVNPGVETVLHSGDHDIRSLDRDWGFHVGNLFDTSIAAAFVGSERLGLASTLQDFMGVTIPKEKNIQRSDWSVRPLSDEALAYAAGDVRHLFGLRERLVARLRALDRIHWVREECDRLAEIRYNPPDPELAVFAVRGSRELDGQRACHSEGADGVPGAPRASVRQAALPRDSGWDIRYLSLPNLRPTCVRYAVWGCSDAAGWRPGFETPSNRARPLSPSRGHDNPVGVVSLAPSGRKSLVGWTSSRRGGQNMRIDFL